MRIVSSSTSASETLTSPATTRPLSSTRSSTSTRPVDREGPSGSVGIGRLFYETITTQKRDAGAGCWMHPNGAISAMVMPELQSTNLVWNCKFCTRARQFAVHERTESLQRPQQLLGRVDDEIRVAQLIGSEPVEPESIPHQTDG